MSENSDPNVIVKAAIYPPIGVMRVGNSKKEYFIGPLVDEPEVKSDIYAYRDKAGALKRQAAQFRIYGLNVDGEAVKELTMDNADITWHSQLANQKSSWYQFQIALDIPEALAPDIPPSLLRNIDVKDRDALMITGKPHKVSKPNVKKGNKFEGKFFSESVYLGEMRTDEKGRLIMLGGHGVSANVNGNIAVTFANNEGWHDDMSDGPVTAEVNYKGQTLEVDPAWVICAPPDYAPMQKSVRTMWDLMRNVAVEAKMMDAPEKPSFTKDILPIFERMTNLQWVNAGFAAAFGWGGQFNYTSLEWVEKLNDPSKANLEMRRTISNNFRRFEESGAEAPQLWPWMYGDAVAIPTQGSVRQHSTLSKLQLTFLDQWVQGDFESDFEGFNTCEPKTIDEYPIKEQPNMLTKAAMDFCLADAFHPGCEMTWPMRTSGMYMAPFRLKHAPKEPKTDYNYYGSTMDTGVLGMSAGPLLGGQVAGGVTRWMAVPWQTDTASCRDGYTTAYDPYLPTFWPARVPNNILGEKQYHQVLNPDLPEEERRLAFSDRYFWLDDLPLDGEAPSQTNQINAMVKYFDKLAVVQHRTGVKDDSNFPAEMQIGIVPNKQQEAVLLSETMEEINAMLDSKKLNKKEKDILDSTVTHLSEKGLLDEKLLMSNAKDQLLELVAHELTDEYKLMPAVKNLLSLIASKEHKASGMKTSDYLRKERNETGIPERLIRFQRFIPK
ncbi:LodA/GoxA family CTQ-dependent oxidase [Aquimarina sp. 2201CG14-23]|uniref:LodA/GoxA family CTQ-dependent oxidase n=1 Tax=Aquimarina mycalae TaxID=3040073 RepID=UPI0024780763|nr:LodA/GoxA family CTQ-dependent oxidase [Aquimarina sp. 2201CG14-23]MDH7447801.1 LodA/GoxA family CTQ-dependent oxidase [Aquimarina sp. 2201CG14-23]